MLSNEEIRRRRIWNDEEQMWVDEVEYSPEYEEAMESIQPILDAEFDTEHPTLGQCHAYWARKSELLAAANIDWKSPAEINPDIIFD